MNLFKYICVERDGEYWLHVFLLDRQHDEEAARLGLPVDSAGHILPRTRECFGESLSLGISAKPGRDTALYRAGKILTTEVTYAFSMCG